MGEPIARYFIAQGFLVTGVDSSASLIEKCVTRLPIHRWVVSDMRELSLEETFDGIIAWDSFFHLTPDEQRRMFDVFASHATPTATLMFTSGPAAGVAIGNYAGDPLYHASLDPNEYRTLLHTHGFEVRHHVAEDRESGNHTVWLAQRHARTSSKKIADGKQKS